MKHRSYAEMDGQFWLDDLKNSENTGLDLEFRQILCIIKHYIPFVDSNTHLSLYRSWLEKLSSTQVNKSERNKYLLELANQIKSNNLSPPFDQRPPLGPLNNFPEIDRLLPTALGSIPGNPSNNNQTWQVELEDIPQPISSGIQNNLTPVNDRSMNEYPSHYQSQDGSANIFPNPVNPMHDNIYYHLYHTRQNIYETSKDRPEPELDLNMDKQQFLGVRLLKQNIPNHLQKTEAVKNTEEKGAIRKPHEDSSWCDLTDTSATSLSNNPLGSGDAEKVPNPQECIENSMRVDPKFENNYRKFTSANETNETESYKPPEPTETRFSLKDTNFMSADWKKTIEALQMRLTETMSQNIELKSIIDNLKASLKYETTYKEQIEMKQRRSAELHKQEIETLKLTHEKNISHLDDAYEFKIKEIKDNYELKVEKVKAQYEMRMRELKLQEECDKKEKDKEIHRLSEIIEQQCNRMSNEIVALRQQIESSFSSCVPEEKLFVLQKCVSKMDKLFHKSEKEYLKRIEKLKQELDLRDKVTQIHLKTQRAELIARTSVEKQKQLDEVVNNLEVKYIKMLEHHERQVMESKLQDEEKMEYLRDLLQDNDIIDNTI